MHSSLLCAERVLRKGNLLTQDRYWLQMKQWRPGGARRPRRVMGRWGLGTGCLPSYENVSPAPCLPCLCSLFLVNILEKIKAVTFKRKIALQAAVWEENSNMVVLNNLARDWSKHLDWFQEFWTIWQEIGVSIWNDSRKHIFVFKRLISCQRRVVNCSTLVQGLQRPSDKWRIKSLQLIPDQISDRVPGCKRKSSFSGFIADLKTQNPLYFGW